MSLPENKVKTNFETPMMVQYMELKQKYPDCLLLFRLGDFYELFLEDAKIAADILDITLTARSRGKDGKIPMAGVPYHAIESYLTKLVTSGNKVAICEQLSDPNEPGLVERDVVRVVTPGTIIESKALDKKTNNYTAALFIDKEKFAFTIVDLSTGLLMTDEFEINVFENEIKNHITKFEIKEIILSNTQYENPSILKQIKKYLNINVYSFSHDEKSHKKVIIKHFNVATLESLGLKQKEVAAKSTAIMLAYLKQTQKNDLKHVNKISQLIKADIVHLNHATITNLELFETTRTQKKTGSLFNTIDKTQTSMGGRLLKQWITHPLYNKKLITNRLNAVGELYKKRTYRDALREFLKNIRDTERIIAKLTLNLGNAKDLITLKQDLEQILEIKKALNPAESKNLKEITLKINKNIIEIKDVIDKTILDEPAFDVKNGGIIKDNVNIELDKLKLSIQDSKTWIDELEEKEKERTNIATLKVRFNKVFGYYIEISKSYLNQIPKNYERKQTLVNAERFFTKELKQHEEKILTAEEKINALEYKVFLDTVEYIKNHAQIVQVAAEKIAELDCYISFAEQAQLFDYYKPEITNDNTIKILESRHPVVEEALEDRQFVPNDVLLDTQKNQLLIITGPNMAGKSVYIRQVAINVLLAQIGSFVPAKEAYISPVDKIFVRSGASDVISEGLSTFMVEMVETANILNTATDKSLIIMDEIGRGTSTYDGISIAWSVSEFLVEKNSGGNPKTLFATHYHELEKLEEYYPSKVRNFQMAIQNGDVKEPIFLYKLVKGGAGHSFGIEVAKMAGLPKQILNRAKNILEGLENNQKQEILIKPKND